MEISEIESILLNLSAVLRRESLCAHFTLDYYDQSTGENGDVYPSPQPIKRIFQEDGPLACLGTNGQ
jgi:hypothetical protein